MRAADSIHYRILSKIGGRGMGVIYASEDVKFGRHAAAKFVPKELAWRLDIECSPIILNGTMERGHLC